MGGRIYDPALARFLTPDPMVARPSKSQSFNRYSYVHNSPLMLTDPTGLCDCADGDDDDDRDEDGEDSRGNVYYNDGASNIVGGNTHDPDFIGNEGVADDQQVPVEQGPENHAALGNIKGIVERSSDGFYYQVRQPVYESVVHGHRDRVVADTSSGADPKSPSDKSDGPSRNDSDRSNGGALAPLSATIDLVEQTGITLNNQAGLLLTTVATIAMVLEMGRPPGTNLSLGVPRLSLNIGTWGRPMTLVDHFERHGPGVGATSAADYERRASDFLIESQAKGFPTKVDSSGIIRTYDAARNWFGSYNPDGTTKTFMAPVREGAYWQNQKGAPPWTP